MRIILIYIPFPNEVSALNAVDILISEKLIACGNIISSNSAYFWDNNLCHESEYIVILKTLASKLSEIELKVKEIHSYDLPAIIHWEAGCNEEYFMWVKSQVI